MFDRISKGPKGVTRNRLFEYMLYLCKIADHRSDELDPNAALATANVDMETCLTKNQDMIHQQLAPREVLEHDEHIEQHLQWCVQHHLIVEVILLALAPCSTHTSTIVKRSGLH